MLHPSSTRPARVVCGEETTRAIRGDPSGPGVPAASEGGEPFEVAHTLAPVDEKVSGVTPRTDEVTVSTAGLCGPGQGCWVLTQERHCLLTSSRTAPP